MKIAFINCLMCWGGGEKWHLEHAKHMHNVGHDVTLITQEGSPLAINAKKENLNVLTFKNVFFLNPFSRYKVKKALSSLDLDCIIMNSSKDLKLFAPVAKKCGVKKIVFRRGSDIPIKNTFYNRYLFGKVVTDILANSQASKANILVNNKNLFPKDKITVIYNGINIKQSFVSDDVPNEIPVIATLGRVSYQKRHDIFVRVAEKLKKKGIVCRFVIGGDGEKMAEVKKLVSDLGVEDYVEFAGFIDKPLDFLAKCDVFALTSEWEGFGYVLAEAMLVGKPIVAFDVSSNSELVRDGFNGILIKWNDVDGFASAVESLIVDRSKGEVLSNNGKFVVKENFDFDKNKIEVEKFLMK